MSTQVKFAIPGTVLVPRGVSLLAIAYDAVRDLGQERTFAYMKFLLGCQTDY